VGRTGVRPLLTTNKDDNQGSYGVAGLQLGHANGEEYDYVGRTGVRPLLTTNEDDNQRSYGVAGL